MIPLDDRPLDRRGRWRELRRDSGRELTMLTLPTPARVAQIALGFVVFLAVCCGPGFWMS